MTLSEVRKALATGDYKIIGKYLCENKRDKEIDAYLRHHVPKEKQEQWDQFILTTLEFHSTFEKGTAVPRFTECPFGTKIPYQVVACSHTINHKVGTKDEIILELQRSASTPYSYSPSPPNEVWFCHLVPKVEGKVRFLFCSENSHKAYIQTIHLD